MQKIMMEVEFKEGIPHKLKHNNKCHTLISYTVTIDGISYFRDNQ